MGLEQFPFHKHKQEIPTLTKEVGMLELEVIPEELTKKAFGRFDVSALNHDVVERILNEEAGVLMKMGDSQEDIAEALDIKLRQLGAIKK